MPPCPAAGSGHPGEYVWERGGSAELDLLAFPPTTLPISASVGSQQERCVSEDVGGSCQEKAEAARAE